MGDKSLVKVIGRANGFVDEREYHLREMDAETGLRIFHSYVSVLVSNIETVEDAFFAFTGEEGQELGIIDRVVQMQPILEMLPQILTWDRIKELSTALLAGGRVVGEGIDETEGEIDEKGFCKFFSQNPHEHYVALFYALAVNYPQYFNFLLNALAKDENDDEGDDSTQEESRTPKVKRVSAN